MNLRRVLLLTLAVAALAAVGFAGAVGVVPWQVPVVYLTASFVAFMAYAQDKSAARLGRRRTPENKLHFVALAGGWPGALAASQILRHKSKKLYFRIVFWITVILNLAFLAAFLRPELYDPVRSLLERR